MALAGAFIAVAIMLGIGTQILGGAATDCTTIDDFNATQASAGELASPTAGDTYYSTGGVDYGVQTGWTLQCIENNSQSQSGYGLLIITLIVLAAVVVLSVVRMLS